MKDKLERPFTAHQRADFIIANRGFEIFENDNGIYSLLENETVQNGTIVDVSTCPEESAKRKQLEKDRRKQILILEMEELDKKRIRAVCESEMKTETQSWLDFYNLEIHSKREELSSL